MKTLRVIMFVLAGLLLIAMVSITLFTNLKGADQGELAEYESGNIDDLPDNIVDESLDVEAGLEIGQKAPNFELQSLSGETFKLSDYKGQMVMLNFWASWCPPCRVEMPHMETYYQEFKEEHNIEILAVNMTTLERGSEEKVPEFVNKHELTFPVLMDEKGDVKDLYDVMVYPTTYIINAKGIITDKVNIPLDVDTIKWLVKESSEFQPE